MQLQNTPEDNTATKHIGQKTLQKIHKARPKPIQKPFQKHLIFKNKEHL